MPDYRERRETAKRAAQEGRYPEAIGIYQAIWSDEAGRNEWDAHGLQSALRKSGDVEAALRVGREAGARYPASDPVACELGWAIRESFIKDAEGPVEEEVVEEMLRLRSASREPYRATAPFTRSLLEIADLDLRGDQTERADEITSLLDPLRLDGSPSPYKGHTPPSFRQRYYVLRAKLLLRMHRWPELEALGDAAASDPDICWVNNGEVWVLRPRIRAIAEQGRVEESIELTIDLLKRFNEWYVHADLANYLRDAGREQEALAAAVTAAAHPGQKEHAYKINLFRIISELLIAASRTQEAQPFLQAVFSIRNAKGWKDDSEALDLCHRIGWEPAAIDVRAAEKLLDEAVAALSEELDPRMRGKVKTVLPSGNSGFILDEAGADRFFGGRDLTFSTDQLRPGLSVTFRPTTSFDKKKNRDSQAATDVRIDNG